MRFESCYNILKTWMHGHSINSQGGVTILAIWAYIIWGIWKTRCNARYEDKAIHAGTLIRQVIENVQQINFNIKPSKSNTKWEKIYLEKLNIPEKQIRPRGRWISWEKPPAGRFKVNVDAAWKKNEASGGGVIRGDTGEFIAAFCCTFKCGNVDEAEVLAIVKGVELCQQLQIQNYVIETDSRHAMSLINNHGNVFTARYAARKYALHKIEIVHVYREQNTVADLLSRNRTNKIYNALGVLPSEIQKEMAMNRLGVPRFRKSEDKFEGNPLRSEG
ncbi:hypothetical protein CASFOL_016379 [Castilleja foliolosa]|uniref:RNase H type-1 domain-containing protein n=1 Tax=Castilleja foliolosa TaxID=1961234 RepID=A0ABD3DKH5_9LAMI